MEFSTKYWIIVVAIALILCLGTGALSVWICKLYDTEKLVSLPPGVSPFPDVVPYVMPPATDPTVNNCYKWCSDGKPCPEVKPTPCPTGTDEECQSLCTVPNSVTAPAVCTNYVCSPPYQNCMSNFPTFSGTDSLGNPVQVADPSNLKKCITNQDCNVCKDTPSNETMNCVFVDDNSTVTLCGGDCQVQGIPEGYYCLPEKTGCDAKAGVATWTDQGWECDCLWPTVMGGPQCNILLACNNNEVTNETKAQQQLLVNCNDSSNPFCGQPWTPESAINPTDCYDQTLGFGNPIDCNDPKAAPNCVCQCDGTQLHTYKGYTYNIGKSPSDSLTCVLDPCNNGAWGRTLTGDAGYLLNAIPGVLHSLQMVSPVQNKFLTVTKSAPLALSDSSFTKFQQFNGTSGNDIEVQAALGVYQIDVNPNSLVTRLSTNAQGTFVGAVENVNPAYPDGMIWVLEKVRGTPFERADNLDTLMMYNPKGNRPSGAQFTDLKYKDENRYLVYNTTTNSFTLGSSTDPGVVLLQRVNAYSLFNDTTTTSQPGVATQPMTNCACSGANSVSSLPACFDSNDNFVNFKSLMSLDDWKNCDKKYERNVSAICDPYVIPNSVLTVNPNPGSATLCNLYKNDLLSVLGSYVSPTQSTTNLLPFKSGFVPGLDYFLNPITGVEELQSVCAPDPCTGKYGDPAFSIQSNSGTWSAITGKCTCSNGNTDDTTQNYYPFTVDYLNQQWNTSCTPDSTSTACVCNHVTNPVCAVCQNACQGSTFCRNSTDYPCESPSNMSCDTDPVKGGAVCICKNPCMNVPDDPQVCMGRIPNNGLCTGLEGKPGVCLDDAASCKKMNMSWNNYYVPANGFPTTTCADGADTISYCTDSSENRCWNSKDPNNGPINSCVDTDGLETCPN